MEKLVGRCLRLVAAVTVTSLLVAFQSVEDIRNAAQGADETGETSSRMFASAQNLSSESLHLKAEVEKFLDRVRAA